MSKKTPAKPNSGAGANTPCDAATASCPLSSIEWKKQPGASDEDLKKAKKMWEDAKSRRLPDGSKPSTVSAMEILESSDKKTTINVGANGNGASPDSRSDSQDPSKGSNANINFNPDKKGGLGDGVTRDPESSLAHEAYHGYEYTQGTSGKTREAREKSATSAENEHRKAKGLKQRKSYGKWPIKQH